MHVDKRTCYWLAHEQRLLDRRKVQSNRSRAVSHG